MHILVMRHFLDQQLLFYFHPFSLPHTYTYILDNFVIDYDYSLIISFFIYCYYCQCLVNVMRRTDDKQKTDGTSSTSSSSSKSCVVENENFINNNSNETVTVNNCVNYDLNANNNSPKGTDDSANSCRIETLARAVHQDTDVSPPSTSTTSSMLCDRYETNDIINALTDESLTIANSSVDNLNTEQDKENVKHNNDYNDNDDTLTTSKYMDVSFDRCEILQPCSVTSTSLQYLPHVTAQNQYTPNRDNNRNHQRAVRKNFSLWIGVTSCVWACLVWLMRNYAS